MKNRYFRVMVQSGLILLFAAGLTACSQSSDAENIGLPSLQPYQSPTPSATITPPAPGTSTPMPSPTPTPRMHDVVAGESFSVIAFNYGVSITALQAANPDINPSVITVGMTLVIPPPSQENSGDQYIPSPTPVSVNLSEPDCYPSQDGGVWCFVLVHNDQATAVENIQVQILLAGTDQADVASQTALSPLNVLPAGQSIALSAYFPTPAPRTFEAQANLVVSLPVPAGDTRYLAAIVNDLQVTFTNAVTAQVSGAITLENPQAAANLIWVAATAYDVNGRVVGVHRWESTSALATGQSLPFSMQVYSAGAPVDDVEVLVEAQP
ncbi:MAG TPA: LysM domain-containing protein [Longilinea sp.]|nr:LysM domain-containing protein [Longilinea sp.]